MPIAVIVAAVGAAAALNAAAPRTLPVPAVAVDIAAAANVSAEVIRIAAIETDAIFRSACVRSIWQHDQRRFAMLRVVIGAEPGPPRDANTPLGWLMFENGAPLPEIHLSHANAEKFLEESREVVGLVSRQ